MKLSLFKKKAPKVSALERVKELSAQGFSEAQIIKTLKDEGYSPREVDEALKETVRKAVAPSLPSKEELLGEKPAMPEVKPPEAPLPEAPLPGAPPEKPVKPPGIPPEVTPEVPLPGAEEWKPPQLPERPKRAEEELPKGEELRVPPLKPKEPLERRAEIEEIAEAIIDERWEAFEREKEELKGLVKDLKNRLEALETAVKDVIGIKKSDIEEIKLGLENYRASLSDFSERIESLEKVMRDSMTPMLQTLRALSDTIKELKKKKKGEAPAE
ncbi:MAG: hypothetical protein DRP12_00515 [Candidatus Aenigmatarchaeota archaeon]|nr:MAG: hypothetical protein DRP12_00515 [Candidatus Aenigmarchaeota archaeon]